MKKTLFALCVTSIGLFQLLVSGLVLEMKRVLKPTGKLLFCEHGVAPDLKVKKVQDFINPVWKKLAGGCNLNKNIPQLITSAGFEITKINTMYIPGWRPASYNFWGTAVPTTNAQ